VVSLRKQSQASQQSTVFYKSSCTSSCSQANIRHTVKCCCSVKRHILPLAECPSACATIHCLNSLQARSSWMLQLRKHVFATFGSDTSSYSCTTAYNAALQFCSLTSVSHAKQQWSIWPSSGTLSVLCYALYKSNYLLTYLMWWYTTVARWTMSIWCSAKKWFQCL